MTPRKDLDEVSEKTGVSLKSCRRQFDNIKRIFKGSSSLQSKLSALIKVVLAFNKVVFAFINVFFAFSKVLIAFFLVNTCIYKNENSF